MYTYAEKRFYTWYLNFAGVIMAGLTFAQFVYEHNYVGVDIKKFTLIHSDCF